MITWCRTQLFPSFAGEEKTSRSTSITWSAETNSREYGKHCQTLSWNSSKLMLNLLNTGSTCVERAKQTQMGNWLTNVSIICRSYRQTSRHFIFVTYWSSQEGNQQVNKCVDPCNTDRPAECVETLRTSLTMLFGIKQISSLNEWIIIHCWISAGWATYGDGSIFCGTSCLESIAHRWQMKYCWLNCSERWQLLRRL